MRTYACCLIILFNILLLLLASIYPHLSRSFVICIYIYTQHKHQANKQTNKQTNK